MFENQTTPLDQNPLNPVMPSPGLNTSGSMPTSQAPIAAPIQPQVHTMPDRFHAAGSGGGGSKGPGSSTKRLMIILVVVLVVAGLGVLGLFVFNKQTNKANTNTNITIVNRTRNLNTTQNVNAAGNTNDVVNENVNLNIPISNTNEATNTNTVVNTNVATNSNTVANTNVATNTNSSTTGTPLPSSADTDSDGLTDVEETVYATDANKPDTDGDTFIDGKQVRADGSVIGEVYNGFNPAGTGKLEGSTLVARQANADKQYNLLVPTAWTVTTDASGGMLITPSQQTGETMQIRIHDNPNKLNPKEWYKTISPNSNVDNLNVISVNGLEALYTEDQSTIYFFQDTKVYGLEYQSGTLTQVNFRTTVDMMVRSFKLGAPAA